MAAIGIAAAAGGVAALYLACVLGTGRFATPNAKYTVLQTIQISGARPIELRRYEGHHVAETRVPATEMRKAGSQGFRVLAGYIFGGTQDGSKISMTTPVALAPRDGSGHVVHFFLPGSLAAPPGPSDSRVNIRAVPEALLAVRALTASIENLDGARFRDAAEALERDATAAGFSVVNASAVQFSYDPPWTPWFMRRNEVAVEICQ